MTQRIDLRAILALLQITLDLNISHYVLIGAYSDVLLPPYEARLITLVRMHC